MENGLSASDVALMSGRGNECGYGDGFTGIFGLLVLLGIMNGGFGNWNNNGLNNRWATTQDVNNSQQFGQLLDGNRDIIAQGNSNTNALLSAINSAEYENINVVKDAQMQLQERLADLHVNQQNILANQNQCCCNTRLEIANQSAGINQNIMQNRYESALNTASINANTNEKIQKVLDVVTGNRIADMQSQIYALQLGQATAGMLKFPNTWTYGAGAFPPIPFAPAVA